MVDEREELMVLSIAMTRRECEGLTLLQARRGERSLSELVRSLVLQALLEESVDEVARRQKEKASSEKERLDAEWNALLQMRNNG